MCVFHSWHSLVVHEFKFTFVCNSGWWMCILFWASPKFMWQVYGNQLMSPAKSVRLSCEYSLNGSMLDSLRYSLSGRLMQTIRITLNTEAKNKPFEWIFHFSSIGMPQIRTWSPLVTMIRVVHLRLFIWMLVRVIEHIDCFTARNKLPQYTQSNAQKCFVETKNAKRITGAISTHFYFITTSIET